MNNMEFLDLVEKARKENEALLSGHPDQPPLASIQRQLEYLRDYAGGQADGGRLKDINVGLIAAREIEGWNDKLADILHKISAQVRVFELTESLTRG
jgi:hypothetical protein